MARTGLAIKLPDSLSFENGASLSVAVLTCAQAMYQILGLPLPNNPTKAPLRILIHGGSTATGTIAIQLAKL